MGTGVVGEEMRVRSRGRPRYGMLHVALVPDEDMNRIAHESQPNDVSSCVAQLLDRAQDTHVEAFPAVLRTSSGSPSFACCSD